MGKKKMLISLVKIEKEKNDLPQTNRSDIMDRHNEALEQISKGEKTLNQIREEFGLEPIEEEGFNTLFTRG